MAVNVVADNIGTLLKTYNSYLAVIGALSVSFVAVKVVASLWSIFRAYLLSPTLGLGADLKSLGSWAGMFQLGREKSFKFFFRLLFLSILQNALVGTKMHWCPDIVYILESLGAQHIKHKQGSTTRLSLNFLAFPVKDQDATYACLGASMPVIFYFI
jgi:hypothetical protein